MGNAFRETKKLFIAHTGYAEPLTFEEWMATPDSNKAAVLFVQFYEEITLAWFKTKSFFIEEEDGVDTMIQYLIKNVPIIKSDKKKFTPNYIYRVAYNCLYCISHDVKRDIDRWNLEISNIVPGSEDREVNLFDLVPDGSDSFDDTLVKGEFWAIIEDCDKSTQKVIEHLLNGSPLKKAKMTKSIKEDYDNYLDPIKRQAVLDSIVCDDKKEEAAKRKYVADRMESNAYRYNNYQLDDLKSIEVTAEQAEKIIAELRIKLAKFKDHWNI